MIVLDASAVLALLQDEEGADAVEEAIEAGANISSVNLSEVLTKMVDAGASSNTAADLIVSLFVEVVPFGLDSAVGASRIREIGSSSGLSLGDRACLALAVAKAAPAITADRAWLQAADLLGVEIQLIR